MKLDNNHGCVINKMGAIYDFICEDNSTVRIKWCEYCGMTEVIRK